MTEKNTDLTFFTNKEGRNLLDRFKTTLTDTQLFKDSVDISKEFVDAVQNKT